MCLASESERLTDVHLVTLVLRLALDNQGQVVSGELVDTESTVTRRFRDKNGLIRTVLALLETRQSVERTECPQPKSSTE